MAKTAPEISLSFIRIDRNLDMPVYLQLYQQIRDGILSGMLRHSERMPSSRLFSSEFGISRNTVTAAFDQLIIEGYLEGAIGSGTFVSNHIGRRLPIKTLSPTQTNPPDPFLNELNPLPAMAEQNLAADSPAPFQISLTATKQFPFAIWSSIASKTYKNIHQLNLGYSDAQGYLPLRTSISNYLRLNRSIDCDPAQVVIVNGSRQALHLACRVLLQEGARCWMEDPGYNGAHSAILHAKAVICPVPVSSKGIDLDYAMKHYPDARAAFITPSNQFPLGGTMPLAERLRLIEWAHEKKMWVIEDDYDSEFRYNGRPIPSLLGLDTYQRVIYAGTFSKILFPALRIGYVVMPDRASARLLAIAKGLTDRQNPIIDQAILSQFMDSGHFSRHLRRMRLLYKKQLDIFVHFLHSHLAEYIDISTPEAGMHLTVWLKKGLKADAVSKKARSEGFKMEAVNSFGQHFMHPEGLILGYTGFSEEELSAGVLKLKEILMNLSGNS